MRNPLELPASLWLAMGQCELTGAIFVTSIYQAIKDEKGKMAMIKSKRSYCALCLLALLLILPEITAANESSSNPKEVPQSEVEALKRRVADLEAQNSQVLRLLAEVQAKLDRISPNYRQAALRQDADKPAMVEQAVLRTKAPASVPNQATASPAQANSSSTPGASSVSAASGIQWPEIISRGNKVRVYGAMRLDMDMDSQIPNNAQIPFYISSKGSTGGKNSSNFTMHPRLTRIGFDYIGSPIEILENTKLTGKLELDFLNGGSESRQIVRIRHAYLKLQKGQFSFLGGQFWDVFSPLFPTVGNESVMWNVGNPGDRRPQARFSYDPRFGRNQWSFTGAVGLTSAVDMLDLDSDGLREGEVSGLPDVQGYMGYSRPLWVKAQAAALGISGRRGWQSSTRQIAGRSDFGSQGINIDYTLPLTTRIALRGEGWFGRNLSDVRGGIGQSINLQTGREIRARGGWTEVKIKFSRYFTLHPGFSIDDPVDSDLPAGARTRNRTFYLAHRITLAEQFLIGLDYLRWKTDFKGLLPGIDNRFNIFIQYGF